MPEISPFGGLGGLAAGLDQASRRRETDAETQRLIQALAFAKWQQDMAKQDRERRERAETRAGDVLPDLADFKTESPPVTPPGPGAPSAPMMPPGAPPGTPPGGAPPVMGGQQQNPMIPFLTRPPMPGGPQGPMPPQPDSWRGMPTPPPQAGVGPGAAPPGAPKQEDAILNRRLLSTQDIAKMLQAKGIKGQDAFDVLETLRPHMDQDNKTQLTAMLRENSALKAAVQAYQANMRIEETQRHHQETEDVAKRAREQADERIAIAKQKLKLSASKAAGGVENLKNVEYIYPKGADGLPDETQAPIGTRATTKGGKIIYTDAEGNVRSQPISGQTTKEGKDIGGKQKQAEAAKGKTIQQKREEYNMLQKNYARRPEDTKRMNQLADELRAGGEKVATDAELATQANAAIKAGKDPKAVRERYKQMTGKDLP